MNSKIETIREREASRIAPELFEHARSFRTSSLCCADSRDHHALPTSLSDPALDAFAQLGAFRLDVTRCLISVFDRNHQYIVAEATRQSVLAPSHGQTEEIWLGGTAIARSHGICEHVLVAPDDIHDDPSTAKLPVSVVPDLAEDSRFCDRPYIHGPPCNRFYAGVPLKAGKVNIGVLCVFDENPRAGLDTVQIECLRGLSQIIMGYLQFKESATGFRRSERMVRGLGSFVEGNTSMTDVQIGGSPAVLPTANTEQDAVAQQTSNSHNSQDNTSERITEPIQHQRPSPVPLQTPSGSGNESSDVKTVCPPESGHTNSATFTSDTLSSARTISTLAPPDDPQFRETRRVFSRAASIIRESLEVEGVLFLDASVRSYGGLIEADEHQSPTSLPSLAATGGDLTKVEEPGLRTCNTLGYATSVSSSIDKAPIISPDIRVPEKLLRELLKRYPLGRVFHFDVDGSNLDLSDEEIDPPDTAETELGPPPGRKLSDVEVKKQEAELIAAIFPHATSVSLIPLWDTRRERWFAGSFVWTTTAARSLKADGETSYLRAFASTIMAEVDRVHASSAEQSKNDLLGSLSHELRSPLHGIVAAVELLQDTELDAFQGDLLQNMDACGRTLLDVIDHLLDHSKINRLARYAKEHDGAAPNERLSGLNKYHSFQSQIGALSHPVDLDSLVEETVESMFTAHSSQTSAVLSLRHGAPNHGLSQRPTFTRTTETHILDGFDIAPATVAQPSVSVYLDIDHDTSWYCQVEAGAIRRIIMNLLGNSLKFTKSGFIMVSMKQEQFRTKHRKYQTQLVLTVLDSGKGIGHDFLQHHAFEPFSQEDPLSQGTGLGLSLISEVLRALGGTIRLESQLGRGTLATVCVPLKASCVLSKRDSQFAENVTALKGLRVSLSGLNTEAEAACISSGKPPIQHDLMETVCREWLHLEPVVHGSEDIRPDIIVCTDIAMHDKSIAKGFMPPPVVIVCQSAQEAHSLSLEFRQTRKGEAFEFISQPVGPRKLANAMILALGRYNDAKASDLVYVEVPRVQPMGDNSMITPDYTPGVEVPGNPSWIPDLIPPTSQAAELLVVPPHDTGVSLTLPLRQILSQPIVVKDGLATPDPTRPQILLVDDNNINLQILVSFMKKLKYNYKTATNGLEAFEIFSANPESFSHILMDISMPVMDGLESTRNIRALEAAQQLAPTKVIALTGLVSADAQQEAFASGVDMYMTKPVRFKNLSSVLSSATSQQK
ncbi:hypothetical protein PFICI_00184 [Pestalotiopsis fici W106-1]|uniref:histidine kinase n=1 Tax=Pestalotiopsis fici (strain W106-1 / CGMCC3.15140) TaxID=1229662 RepID=W3XM66_PESFW|nr:uncharacterized protein PFICI_00184 [Pestalotiopsis fici W106-1]ETS86356.1 hypothetical protein PFICI_00184 [Pestalotiopsis fici W106-1]